MRRATRAAVFTVPSPPYTPSTRARPAASSSRADTSPGAHSTTSAPGRASRRARARSAVPEALFATRTSPSPRSSAGTSACGRAGGVTWPRVGTSPRTANAAPAPRAAPARASLGRRTPVCTRDRVTEAATGATTAPQPGDSSATPVANAAADAACPSGNEGVTGCRFSRRSRRTSRTGGTACAAGWGRRTERLPRAPAVREATPREARPRAAALRARGVRLTARAAAAANQSAPWPAPRPSRGRTGSAPGRRRPAAASKRRRSRVRARSRRGRCPGFGTVRSGSWGVMPCGYPEGGGHTDGPGAGSWLIIITETGGTDR